VFGIRSAATAIATGNTAILKGSELTPRCYWAVGKAFHEAGLPAGVLNILSCPPSKAEEIVNVMIEHPAVRHINFTGSAAVGRKVAKMCGQNLKPCLMELGGKNSAIVLKDADLQKAVGACIVGSFLSVRPFACVEYMIDKADDTRPARYAWQQTESSYMKKWPRSS
jgi:acyl-CoA reductase-like NAD-dependent aldehyde dehydrogenase